MKTQNVDCYSPLHLAALKGNPEIIKALFKFGAKIDELTRNNQNMIHLGAISNKPFSIVYFKEKG